MCRLNEYVNILSCSVLQCAAVSCSNTLMCRLCFSSSLKRVAVRCSEVQCVAVCCNVLQCGATWYSVLQRVAVCRSVLQCVAVCCSHLQARDVDLLAVQ